MEDSPKERNNNRLFWWTDRKKYSSFSTTYGSWGCAQPGETIFKLSKIINFDQVQKKILLKRIKKRKPWQPIIVSDNLSWPEFSRLNLFLHEIQGVKPVVSEARKNDGKTVEIIAETSQTIPNHQKSTYNHIRMHTERVGASPDRFWAISDRASNFGNPNVQQLRIDL